MFHFLPMSGTCFFVLFFLFVFCPFRAAPSAHGGSQARGPIGAVAVAAGLCQIQATSLTYTTARGNAGSLTH